MVQASEKLHKAAEEAVKALAWTQANGVCKEVEEKGRWTSPFRAEDKPRRYNMLYHPHPSLTLPLRYAQSQGFDSGQALTLRA